MFWELVGYYLVIGWESGCFENIGYCMQIN